jgi:hypothetical protein
MPPAKPAGKTKPKRPRCKVCEKPIHIPAGWSVGPAVRRHYWAKHRDVMQPHVAKKS